MYCGPGHHSVLFHNVRAAASFWTEVFGEQLHIDLQIFTSGRGIIDIHDLVEITCGLIKRGGSDPSSTRHAHRVNKLKKMADRHVKEYCYSPVKLARRPNSPFEYETLPPVTSSYRRSPRSPLNLALIDPGQYPSLGNAQARIIDGDDALLQFPGVLLHFLSDPSVPLFSCVLVDHHTSGHASLTLDDRPGKLPGTENEIPIELSGRLLGFEEFSLFHNGEFGCVAAARAGIPIRTSPSNCSYDTNYGTLSSLRSWSELKVSAVQSFDDEIRYIWNRYMGDAMMVLNILRKNFELVTVFGPIICVWSTQMIMQLRLYVMYNNSRKLLAFTLTLLLAEMAGMLVAVFVWLRSIAYTNRPLAPFISSWHMCAFTSSGRVLTAVYVPIFSYELMMFSLALFSVFKRLRVDVERWKINPLQATVRMLLRDSIIYFLACFTACAVATGMYLSLSTCTFGVQYESRQQGLGVNIYGTSVRRRRDRINTFRLIIRITTWTEGHSDATNLVTVLERQFHLGPKSVRDEDAQTNRASNRKIGASGSDGSGMPAFRREEFSDLDGEKRWIRPVRGVAKRKEAMRAEHVQPLSAKVARVRALIMDTARAAAATYCHGVL
ncbi:hypothetical protein CONPUDRAFT_72180 [Coniophora puteana RWD-64-598 SS2]|uniref:Uncharacterized protein n=1 Tax=Coniophora puteana (strain RWD-64-598) TaxID=741705 RepID=A0A5M3MRK1_CONPW|nr:uncharacterized protein CONPUDRAFT_72180 [Coniophora puteana RWD-64-598 SS2]EIW81788.1 hypothetical protein CONPUDRAFT_72180 [Coniophora puteana RWD-64-598 SS2]